jgi:hypothetical protein
MSTRRSRVHRKLVGWDESCLGKHSGCIEEVTKIIVSTSRKVGAIGRPCETADLLSMDGDSCNQRQRTRPVEKISIRRRGPFNDVKVNIASLISDKKFLCIYRNVFITRGWPLCCSWAERHATDWAGLVRVKSRLTIKRAV